MLTCNDNSSGEMRAAVLSPYPCGGSGARLVLPFPTLVESHWGWSVLLPVAVKSIGGAGPVARGFWCPPAYKTKEARQLCDRDEC